MKIRNWKSFNDRKLNELMSLDNYDAVRFIANNLVDELDKLLKSLLDDKGKFIYNDSSESKIIYKVTEVIINSIIEFYELEDNELNRKKINSLFYLDYHRFMILQLNIKNKKKYFDIIIANFTDRRIFYSNIGKMVGDLVELLEKKYPKWGELGDFKKKKILPYKKTPFEGDELSRGIYDWNVTFDTLEKLFCDFLFENLEDVEYEKYKTIIDSNMDRFKDYVEKNDYKPNISYLNIYPNVKNVMISTLKQDKIYDKKYLLKYIETLRDIGLFDRDFINFLFTFEKFIEG